MGNGDLAFEGLVKSRLRGLVNAISFFATYSLLFDKDLLFSAEYISNLVDVREPPTHDFLLEQAEYRVLKYSKAKLVVTSRIHCAIPCLGLRTPTIFVIHEDMNDKGVKFNTPGRFDGLTDFFRIIKFCGNTIVSDDEEINKIGHIGINSRLTNKPGWEYYEEKLHKVCSRFVNNS